MKQPKRTAWGFIPKIIDRYVSREYLISYFIAILVVLSLRVLLDLFVTFDEFVEIKAGQHAPGTWEIIGNIASFYGPKIFEYFRDFSGTIILLAAAFSLTRMTRYNELTAILASGISLQRVIAPIVLLGFVLNMVMVFDQEEILPRLADKLSRNQDEVETMDMIPIWLLPDKKGSLLSAEQYDPVSKVMYRLTVILRKNRQMIGIVSADRAENYDGQAWTLVNGKVTYYYDNPDEQNKTVQQVVTRYPSNLTPEYLWLQRNSSFKSLLSSRELDDLLKRSKTMKPIEYNETISEKYFRVTEPIINMIMLLLGLPLLVSREKHNTKTAIGFAFLGAGGCFLATFACKLLGGEYLNPLLAAWLPIIVFLPLSVLAVDGIKT